MPTIQHHQVLQQDKEWAEHNCENVYFLKNLDKLETFQGTLKEWRAKHTSNILKLKKGKLNPCFSCFH